MYTSKITKTYNMAVPQLSDMHLNQLLGQIKELWHAHDGTPGKLSRFVNQVEQLLNLYATQNAGKHT